MMWMLSASSRRRWLRRCLLLAGCGGTAKASATGIGTSRAFSFENAEGRMSIASMKTDPARQLRVRLSNRLCWEDRETRMYTRRIGSTGDNRGKNGFGRHEPSVMLIVTESWGGHNVSGRKKLVLA